ncbi:MAG: hypothetical protein ACXWLK_04570 [Rhizomicrobium sp.]
MNERRVSRRTMVVGGGVAAALGAAALGLTLPRLFGRRYAPTPYDDLLAQLVDRDAAARVGAAVRAIEPNFNTKAAARELRQRFEQRNLAEVIDADIREGRVAEVSGWVLPESLAQLCALAAG